MLQFSNLRKEFGDRSVISVDDFSIPQGIYWLQGDNGSGKTTLLKMIGGLLPFSGDISLYGVNQHNKPTDYRRLQSFSEAEPSYPPFITGEEMIRFHRHIRKDSDSKTDSLIGQMDPGKFLSAPVGAYSSGMLKKLSILLSFIGHPKLILFDEPLATLDADAAILLPKLMMEYHNAYGCSFIFSSHHSFPDEKLIIHRKLLMKDKIVQFVV